MDRVTRCSYEETPGERCRRAAIIIGGLCQYHTDKKMQEFLDVQFEEED